VQRKLKVVPIVLVILATLGCIKKASGPVTPWERVTTENAILAQSIDTATQGTIAVQTSGLISAAQAQPVLAFLNQAATVQLQINTILSNPPSASNIPQLQAFVSQIGNAAQALVSTGVLGIKNPKSQQTIGADVQAIVSSVNVILSSYQAATGGK
jgi:hypothetical protein